MFILQSAIIIISYQPYNDFIHNLFILKSHSLTAKKVCDDVTEMVCEIVPYTECEMLMESVPYKSFEVVQKLSKKKVCTAGMDIVKHTKMMPECRNVTKQNCITKWETDENGKQVWAGNEACEPVTWRECKLVPKQVDFKVPKITCDDGEDIAYDDFVETEKNQMTSRMACEVKHTTSCEPKVTNKCQSIAFQVILMVISNILS